MTTDLTIRYVKHADIDKSRWDDAIDQASNGLPYAYSWYLDTMAKGWDALISGDDDYVMPLPYNTKLLGLKQIFQPHFTQQLGVFGVGSVSEAQLKSFLSAIPSKFKYVAYSCNETNPIDDVLGYRALPRTNMTLDLHRSYEEIRKNYRRSLKKRIKKGSGSLVFKTGVVSPSEVVVLYKNELNDKVYLSDRDYGNVIDLISIAIRKKKGDIYSVHDDSGKVLASVFFLKNQKRLIQLLGSATKEGKSLYAMHYLIDRVIEKYSSSGLIFDFEGSEIPSVAEFFRGYGPEVRTYHHVIRDHLPAWMRWLRRMKRSF